jgi:polyisoprenoid-binding protein YceI
MILSSRRDAQSMVGAVACAALVAAATALAEHPAGRLEFVPARTTLEFTLGASFHTVHGAFNLRHGSVHFDPDTGALSGEIIVDAASGHSGNDGRDRKMHREILESARYPDIVFRPDRLEGKVETQGVSAVRVHGRFDLHGAEHEITIPVQVEMAADHWSVTSQFSIPYVEWGLKNPRTLILHVNPSVSIAVHASGLAP